MSSFDSKSIVQFIPRDAADKCGYCKTKRGSKKNGLWAFQLTVEDYQCLINRGWRRCGKYCYKPDLSTSCCCLYTIRCDATKFKLSRSQKRNLKRMNAFLRTGEKPKESNHCPEWNSPFSDVEMKDTNALCKLSKDALEKGTLSGSFDNEIKSVPVFGKEGTREDAPAVVEKGKNASKAKQKRIARKLDKLRAQGYSDVEISVKMVEKKRYPIVKTVEMLTENLPQDYKHRLEVRLVRSSPPSEEFKRTFEESFKLYSRYQIAVHKDEPSSLNPSSYERFLVTSPLIEDGDFGSFHQQYWLDGELIAVGVVDILPECVSSVYLFYDPKFSFLSLGTYSALMELKLARSMTHKYPQLQYYYMGFYIHTCPKMKYKGAYTPSFLLCPESYTWHCIETCRPKIERLKYARLNETEAVDEDGSGNTDEALVIYKGVLRKASTIPEKALAKNDFNVYVATVGFKCARRMISQM